MWYNSGGLMDGQTVAIIEKPSGKTSKKHKATCFPSLKHKRRFFFCVFRIYSRFPGGLGYQMDEDKGKS